MTTTPIPHYRRAVATAVALVLVATVLATAALTVAAPPASAANFAVTLYEHREFRGADVTFYEPGRYRLRDHGFDNRTSSISTFGSAPASLWENVDGTGACIDATEFDALDPRSVGSDTASLLVIGERCPAQFVLYTAKDYGSDGRIEVAATAEGGDFCEVRLCTLFANGSISGNRQVVHGWDHGRVTHDNAASSIWVPYGGIAAVYTEPNFGGRCLAVTAPIRDLSRTTIGNDTISSIRPNVGCEPASWTFTNREFRDTPTRTYGDVPEINGAFSTNQTMTFYTGTGFGGDVSFCTRSLMIPFFRSARIDSTCGQLGTLPVSLYTGPDYTDRVDVRENVSMFAVIAGLDRPVRSVINLRSEPVSLYVGAAYVGACLEVGPNQYIPDLTQTVLGARRPTSLRLSACPPPPRVLFDLGYLVLPDQPLTNDVASLRVDNQASHAVNPSVSPVSIYRDAGFAGACATIRARTTTPVDLATTVLGRGTASSARYNTACPAELQLFDAAGYSSSAFGIRQSTPDLAPLGLAQRASSVNNNLTTPVSLFSLPQYLGRCQTVSPGQYLNLAGSGVGDNAARSIRVGQACPAATDLNALPDIDRNGIGDLGAINRADAGSLRTVIHVLRSDTWAIAVSHITALATTNDNWAFDFGDVDRDGFLDLVAINRADQASGRTAVHVLSSRDHYSTIRRSFVTALGRTDADWTFQVGDVDRDGTTDLLAVDRTDGAATTFHLLRFKDDLQSVERLATGLPATDADWDFELADVDRDGFADVAAIDRTDPSGRTAISLLSYKDGFRATTRTVTGLHATDANWDFEMADQDGDGVVELLAVNRRDAGSNGTAVHRLSSGNGFATIASSNVTALGWTNANWSFV